MKATLTFTPETGALSISGKLLAGQKQEVYLINSDHANNPISSINTLQLTIKADNDKESTSPFVLNTTWVAGDDDGEYKNTALNLDIASLITYLGTSDSKKVEVEIRDLTSNEVLGYDYDVDMYNSVYRTGDGAADPTASIEDTVKEVLAAMNIDITYILNTVGLVLLSRPSSLPKRLVVSDSGFVGSEDAS